MSSAACPKMPVLCVGCERLRVGVVRGGLFDGGDQVLVKVDLAYLFGTY